MVYDVAIIGSGPGGYVAAIRAGQLGKKVLLVEKDKLGGVCLNYGCIPSKAIIHIAHLYRKIKWMNEIGLAMGEIELDYAKIKSWKEQVVDRLRKGIKFLLDSYGVEQIQGNAKIFEGGKIEVEGKSFDTKNIIIATGSSPLELPNLKIDGKDVLDSTAALELTELPKRLLVVGGGAIGLELGCAFQNFGSELFVVEIMDQLLPGFDKEVSEVIKRNITKKGGHVYLNSKVVEVKKANGKINVVIDTQGKNEELEVDKILLSVGRKPNNQDINLKGLGVDKKGFVQVDEFQRTNLENVFAIGDITGPPFLAHRASKQGIVAAEVISGMKSAYDYRAIPSTFFTDPEIISIGKSQEEASKEREILVGKFPFLALGRALTQGSTEGFVKVIADKQSNVILGIQAVGEGVSELNGEATLAIEATLTLEDLGLVMHAHPTLSEALMESAENALRKAIHILNR
ncbi:MAG TPA: dihydrolipoyl dehydrogenase [Geobacterales bacterium]|nr:dihydrolipoyl dehydrogenase [Geobacterales bacterium]